MEYNHDVLCNICNCDVCGRKPILIDNDLVCDWFDAGEDKEEKLDPSAYMDEL